MKFQTLLAIFLFLTVTNSYAATFNVIPEADSDCSDFICDLQSAFDEAAINGETDEINIAAGTYTFDQPLEFYTDTDPSSITITGAGIDATFLQGADLIITENNLSSDTVSTYEIDDFTLDSNSSLILNSENSNLLIGNITVGRLRTITENGNIAVLGSVSTTSHSEINIQQLTNNDLLINAAEIAFICYNGNLILFDNSSVNTGTDGLLVTRGGMSTTISTSSITAGYVSIDPITDPPQQPSTNTGSGSAGVTLCASENCNLYIDHTDGTILTGSVSANGSTVAIDDNSSVIIAGTSDIVDSGVGSITSVTITPVNETFNFNIPENFTELPHKIESFITHTGSNGIEKGLFVAIREDIILSQCQSVDPINITDTEGMPDEMPFGLVDFEIEVATPGDTTDVVIYLSEPAPVGYTWFKYSEQNGWRDFSDHAVFNEARTQVTLTLTDGGIGDDDGIINGIIKDPSGLGLVANTTSTASGGGGCFIATAAYGSYMEPHVMILRQVRDTYLLNSHLGNLFVQTYYKYSPPMADFIARHDWLRSLVRIGLAPVVGISWLALYLGLPLSGLLLTVLLTTLSIVMVRILSSLQPPA